MFEKISDFHNAKFSNLWGGFSCECFVDDINMIVSFYGNNESFSLNGSEAEDILDFVLSEYYENENTVIEDGFNKWLKNYYNNNLPSSGQTKEEKPEEDNLEILYNMVVKEWKKQDKIIKKQKKEIKYLRQRLEKSSITNFNLRKELENLKRK